MRKILTGAMAALTLGGGIAATAVPAQAEGWRGGGGHHDGGGWRGGGAGPAIFAGVAGLAIGAALADSHRGYGYGYGPAYYGYYDGPYDYDYGYRTCFGRTRVWDPYVGAYVIQRTRYAC